MRRNADATDSASVRVLVVEDDWAVRKAMGRALERHGWFVVDTACAREAVEFVRAEGETYHLAVIDVVLAANEDGIQLAEELHRVDPALRFLFVSGHVLLDSTSPAIPTGMSSFVGKPLSVTRLVEEAHRLLSRLPSRA